MIETLKDTDVRRLQKSLRRAVARKKLKDIMKTKYTLLTARKAMVDNRLLFIRIYLDHRDVRYIIDACDLVRTRNRLALHKPRYYAHMIVMKQYVDLSLEYKHMEKLVLSLGNTEFIS